MLGQSALGNPITDRPASGDRSCSAHHLERLASDRFVRFARDEAVALKRIVRRSAPAAVRGARVRNDCAVEVDGTSSRCPLG
jgi:hypothetical protein